MLLRSRHARQAAAAAPAAAAADSRAAAAAAAPPAAAAEPWRGCWVNSLHLSPTAHRQALVAIGAARAANPGRCVRCGCRHERDHPRRHLLTGEPLCRQCGEFEEGIQPTAQAPLPAWLDKAAARADLAAAAAELGCKSLGRAAAAAEPTAQPQEEEEQQQQQQQQQWWWTGNESTFVEQLKERFGPEIKARGWDKGASLQALREAGVAEEVLRQFEAAGHESLYLSFHTLGGGGATDAFLVLSAKPVTSVLQLLPVPGHVVPMHVVALVEAKRVDVLLTEYQQTDADPSTVVAFLRRVGGVRRGQPGPDEACLFTLGELRTLPATRSYDSRGGKWRYYYAKAAVGALAGERSGLGPAAAVHELLALLLTKLSYAHNGRSLLLTRLRYFVSTGGGVALEHKHLLEALASHPLLRCAASISEGMDHEGVDVLLQDADGRRLEVQHRHSIDGRFSMHELNHDSGYVLLLTAPADAAHNRPGRGAIIYALVPGPLLKLLWDAGLRYIQLGSNVLGQQTHFLPSGQCFLEHLGLVFRTAAGMAAALAALLRAGGDMPAWAAACPAIHDAPFWRCLVDTGVPALQGPACTLHTGVVLQRALALMAHPKLPDPPISEQLRGQLADDERVPRREVLADTFVRRLRGALQPEAAQPAAAQPLAAAAAELRALLGQRPELHYLRPLVDAAEQEEAAAAAAEQEEAAAAAADEAASEEEEEEEAAAATPPSSPRDALRAAADTPPPLAAITPDKEEEQQRKRSAAHSPSQSPAAAPLPQRPRGAPQRYSPLPQQPRSSSSKPQPPRSSSKPQRQCHAPRRLEDSYEFSSDDEGY